MGLAILTSLICLAHLSAATCPPPGPLIIKAKSCQSDRECPQGKACCPYSDTSKFCVSGHPTPCMSEGTILKNEQSVILKNNCTICQCQGDAGTVCNSEHCDGSKPKSANCPFVKPSSANKSCSSSTECSSGYTCCKYFQGSFCTSADASKCSYKGGSVPVGNTVTESDGCTECKCFGHDSFICTDEPCYWRSRRGCNYGGEYRDPDSTFPSTDKCNKCWCLSGEVKCTEKICMKNPFFDERKVYDV